MSPAPFVVAYVVIGASCVVWRGYAQERWPAHFDRFDRGPSMAFAFVIWPLWSLFQALAALGRVAEQHGRRSLERQRKREYERQLRDAEIDRIIREAQL